MNQNYYLLIFNTNIYNIYYYLLFIYYKNLIFRIFILILYIIK